MVAGYTYSHSLDDVGANWDFGYGAGLPQDSYHVGREYASSDFDIRHRLTVSLTYAIPGPTGHAQMLEGWELNSIVTLESAQPWGPIDMGTDAAGVGPLPVSPPATAPIRWSFYGKTSDFKSRGGVGEDPVLRRQQYAERCQFECCLQREGSCPGRGTPGASTESLAFFGDATPKAPRLCCLRRWGSSEIWAGTCSRTPVSATLISLSPELSILGNGIASSSALSSSTSSIIRTSPIPTVARTDSARTIPRCNPSVAAAR